MKRPPISLLVSLLLTGLASWLHAATDSPSVSPTAPGRLPDGLYAEFTTPRGVFTARLFYNLTPMTCASFVGLAEGKLGPKNDRPFFKNLTWYRVVPNFVMQSGNPGNKDTGDEPRPYNFPDEFSRGLRHDAAGVLSMANAGPDTNGCEFFVTLRDTNRLNYLHSVFGRVVVGLEVLPKVQPDDPLSIKILRLGEEAQKFKADEATFTQLVARAKKYPGAAEPGPNAHFDDADKLLPSDPPRAKNFNFKLANFERATGIKIAARVLAKFPGDPAGAALDSYAHELAVKLGVDQVGALALYLADRDEWKLWLGDGSATAFLGDTIATAKTVQPDGALNAAKQAFVSAVKAQGEADFGAQQKAAAPDRQPSQAQRMKLQVDAMLDSLIAKLEPK